MPGLSNDPVKRERQLAALRAGQEKRAKTLLEPKATTKAKPKAKPPADAAPPATTAPAGDVEVITYDEEPRGRARRPTRKPKPDTGPAGGEDEGEKERPARGSAGFFSGFRGGL